MGRYLPDIGVENNVSEVYQLPAMSPPGPFRSLPLDERKAHRERGLARRPTHVPVILERSGDDAPELACERFLFTPTLTGAQLHYVVRRQMRLDAEQALFLMCANRLVPAGCTVPSCTTTTTRRTASHITLLENAFEREGRGENGS